MLLRWQGGDAAALEELVPLVYAELRRMADRQLRRERSDHTLQPTAVVHEAFLRLVDQRRVSWQNRAHFFAVAARLMRRVLVDHARAHQAEKRGGLARRIPLEDWNAGQQPPRVDLVDLVDLDAALDRLSALDPDQARVVELRFFGGLTVEETAEVVGASSATVKRDWHSARAFLYRELAGPAG
ncbi:MAG TPA: ECF-type sigma factor [Vicinamibacterales bacterium]|nr:ECF-type sigma factor [Vicinamibacterales bacterium]